MFFLLKAILSIIEFVLVIGVGIITILCVYSEIVSLESVERLLEILRVPLNLWQIIAVEIVLIVLLWFCNFVRTRLP